MLNFLKTSPKEADCFGCIFFDGVCIDLGTRKVKDFICMWENELCPFAVSHKSKADFEFMKEEMTFLAHVLSSTKLNTPEAHLVNNREEIKKAIHIIVNKSLVIQEGQELTIYGNFKKTFDVEAEIDAAIDRFIKFGFTLVEYYGEVEVDDKNGILFQIVPHHFDMRKLKKFHKHHCNIEACTNKSTLKCSQCKLVRYCSRECQKLDWKKHRKCCKGHAINISNFK